MPNLHAPEATEETIRVQAYHLWEQDGRPHGRDLEFWQKAAAMMAGPAAAGKPKAARKPVSVTRAKAKG